jgi:hypothetical protein
MGVPKGKWQIFSGTIKMCIKGSYFVKRGMMALPLFAKQRVDI